MEAIWPPGLINYRRTRMTFRKVNSMRKQRLLIHDAFNTDADRILSCGAIRARCVAREMSRDDDALPSSGTKELNRISRTTETTFRSPRKPPSQFYVSATCDRRKKGD